MRLIDVDALSADLESLETILSKEGWGLVKAVIDRIHRHKAVEVPRWIPVLERMPKPAEIVLVVDADGDFYVAVRSIFGEWINEDYELENITHWMPLPEVPHDHI